MVGDILYATSILPARFAGERIARRRQSSAAQHLLELLEAEGVPTVESKSHSRTAIAAAAGNAEGLSLGIDIEWMAPGRPFATLSSVFLESAPTQLGGDDFYRCWTFAEAYFKAFQRLPSESNMRYFIANTIPNSVLRLHDGANVLQRRIADIFQLCLVWRTATSQPCEVRCVPIEALST